MEYFFVLCFGFWFGWSIRSCYMKHWRITELKEGYVLSTESDLSEDELRKIQKQFERLNSKENDNGK